jgi:hypothetical protein
VSTIPPRPVPQLYSGQVLSWSEYRFQAVLISSSVSPPSFSNTACASSQATAASPTTQAAGTAQVSERSTAAGTASLVFMFTLGRGFFSRVGMGFTAAVRTRVSPLVMPPSSPPRGCWSGKSRVQPSRKLHRGWRNRAEWYRRSHPRQLPP